MANKTLKSLTLGSDTQDLNYVKLIGDTMTGNLYLNTIADATSATNGLTDNITPTIGAIRDKNDKILNRFDGDVFKDGRIFSTFGARNYDSNGTMVANAFLQLLANKDGTTRATVNATKPAANTNDTQIASTAFVQDAITRRIPNALSVNVLNTTAVSIAHNAVGTLNVWNATATGIFIGVACAIFAPNANGYRFADVLYDGSTIGTGIRTQASPSADTQLAFPVITQCTKDKPFVLRYTQGSGGALNVKMRSFRGFLFIA